jgi:CDP-diacylglycerol--serine O-phosphatidyltransferase
MQIRNAIPNALTLGNLLCGFTAILLCCHAQYATAAAFIVAGLVFDFLDGFAARLLRAGSDIGAQLDSLADVVTFCVAPALLLHETVARHINAETPLLAFGIVGLAVLQPLFGAYRLARFNVHPTNGPRFQGLPTPASALFTAGLALWWQDDAAYRFYMYDYPAIGMVLVAALNVLMVSNVPFLSLKVKGLGWGQLGRHYILAALAAVAVWLWGYGATPAVLAAYATVSLWPQPKAV